MTARRPAASPSTPTSAGKGLEKYVATVPQVFDLWQDPQERYDIFMTNFTESTWAVVPANEAIAEADEDLRRLSAAPVAERDLHRPDHPDPLLHASQHVREELEKQGFSLPMPTGN